MPVAALRVSESGRDDPTVRTSGTMRTASAPNTSRARHSISESALARTGS